jgi:hypothetical protein
MIRSLFAGVAPGLSRHAFLLRWDAQNGVMPVVKRAFPGEVPRPPDQAEPAFLSETAPGHLRPAL